MLFSLCFPLYGAYTLQQKGNNLTIYAQHPLSASMSSSLNSLDDRIDALQMQLGIYVDDKAPIWLIDTEAGYQELALGKAQIVEFSEAFYSAAEDRIYLRPLGELKEDYLKVLLHEYIHWYLEKVISNAPLWFHEGMAMHFSGQMGFERYLSFLQLSFMGRKSDLFRLSTAYPEQQADWQLFYLSSSMAVRYMADKQADNWKRFWDWVAYYRNKGQPAEFTNCFILAYDTSLYDFHQDFAKWVRSLRWQYLFWGFNGLLALLLPIVLVLGHRIRRKRLLALPDLPEAAEDEEIGDAE